MNTKENKRRRKGDGSISRLPTGKYRGRISLDGQVHSCIGNSEAEVKKKLAELRKSSIREEVIPERLFVGAFIEKWMEEVKKPALKPASYDRLERTYEKQIKKSRVARCQLGNITPMDIQRLINELAKTLSYSSIKKVYELLNSCFEYAVASRQMSYNPVKAVQMPKEENLLKRTKIMPVFTPAELEKIENLKKSNSEEILSRMKYVFLFQLLANTGCRIGEALALTWENVDLHSALIQIKQSIARVKNRSEQSEQKYQVLVTSVKTKQGNRTIPCNDKAMEALLWLKKYQMEHGLESDFVICNETGGPLSQHNLPRNLRVILNAAEVPYKNIHAFRHAFATNLIEAGADVKTVSYLMGHASVKITMDTYVHASLDRAIDAVGKLGK